MMNAIGRERGCAPIGRPEFDALCSPRGALLVGSPQEVIEKILSQHEVFGHQRFLAQITVGTLPHEKALRDRAARQRGRPSRSRGDRAPRRGTGVGVSSRPRQQ